VVEIVASWSEGKYFCSGVLLIYFFFYCCFQLL